MFGGLGRRWVGGCMKGGWFGAIWGRWVHERRVAWGAGGCMKGGWFGVQVGA